MKLEIIEVNNESELFQEGTENTFTVNIIFSKATLHDLADIFTRM